MIIANVRSHADLARKKQLQKDLLEIEVSNEAELEKRVRDYKNPYIPKVVPPVRKTRAELLKEVMELTKSIIDKFRDMDIPYDVAQGVVAEFNNEPDSLIQINALFPAIRRKILESTIPSLLTSENILDIVNPILRRNELAYGFVIDRPSYKDVAEIEQAYALNHALDMLSSSVENIVQYSNPALHTDVIETINALKSVFPDDDIFRKLQTSDITENTRYNFLAQLEATFTKYQLPTVKTLTELNNELERASLNSSNVILRKIQRALSYVNTKAIEALTKTLIKINREITEAPAKESARALQRNINQFGDEALATARAENEDSTLIEQQVRAKAIEKELKETAKLRTKKSGLDQSVEDKSQSIPNPTESYPQPADLSKKEGEAKADELEPRNLERDAKEIESKYAFTRFMGLYELLTDDIQLELFKNVSRRPLMELTDDEEDIFSSLSPQKQKRLMEAFAGFDMVFSEIEQFIDKLDPYANYSTFKRPAILELKEYILNRLFKETPVVAPAPKPLAEEPAQPQTERERNIQKHQKYFREQFAPELLARPEDEQRALLRNIVIKIRTSKKGIYNAFLPDTQIFDRPISSDDMNKILKELEDYYIKRQSDEFNVYKRVARGAKEKAYPDQVPVDEPLKYGIGMKKKKTKAKPKPKRSQEEEESSSDEEMTKPIVQQKAFQASRIKVGKGIEVQEEPRYKTFGKYVIHMPQLHNNNLNFKYPKSLGTVPHLRPTPVSGEYRDFIIDVIDSGKMNEKELRRLPEHEQKHFEKVVVGCGLIETLKLKKTTGTDEKVEADRFNLLRGEYLAGNNAPTLIKELRGFVLKFMDDGRIKRKDGMSLLAELAVSL